MAATLAPRTATVKSVESIATFAEYSDAVKIVKLTSMAEPPWLEKWEATHKGAKYSRCLCKGCDGVPIIASDKVAGRCVGCCRMFLKHSEEAAEMWFNRLNSPCPNSF